MPGRDYLRDAGAIYEKSFARVREEARLDRFDASTAEMVVRVIHACGMTDITGDIVASDGIMEKTADALRGGATVLCDAGMVAAGVTEKFLPNRNKVVVSLRDKRVVEMAARLGTTRSAAAAQSWREDGLLDGAVIAIGNAPTALFHLLEMLEGGAPKPAAILGFPVGFVGATESKAWLAQMRPCPFITLAGTRGGTAMAAAAVNAGAVFASKGGGS